MMRNQQGFVLTTVRVLIGLLVVLFSAGTVMTRPLMAQANALIDPVHPAQETFVALAPAQRSMETIQIHMGTAAGELKFVPDVLHFEAGHRYRLVLDNPSPVKHYFTAKDFADAIWSQKVEAGNVEVKGTIHELELKPGATAEWVFVPQKPGRYELHCSIPGHAEAGMVGEITIS
jgi:uncharacterized cupredoxin-like copper-binding protein